MNYSWKNWKGLIIASSVLFAGLFGCNNDYSEKDFLNDQADLAAQNALLEDSLAKARMMDSLKSNGYLIDYTVKVVSANEASFNNRRQMDTHSGGAAIVTFTQGDSIATVTANEQGFAYFPNVTPGIATVNVELADHTPVSMNIEFLSPEALSAVGPFTTTDSSYYYNEKDSIWTPYFEGKNYDVIKYRNASTIIPVFNVSDSLGTSEISGKAVYVSSVVTATRSSVPDGTRISASIDASNSTFTSRYLDNWAGTSHQSESNITDLRYQDYLSPRILKAAYEGALSSTTTSGGMYSLRVPTAVNGLPIRLQFSDFMADQEIAFNKIKGEAVENPRVESISTIFSSLAQGVGNSRLAGDAVGQSIPSVVGAKVEIAAPPVSGSGATVQGSVVPRDLQTGEITDPTSGDYDLVVITSGGSGYTGGEDSDALSVTIGGSTTGVNALAYARVEGPVDSIAIKTQSNNFVMWEDGTLEDAVNLTASVTNASTPETGSQVDLSTTLSFEGTVKNIAVTNGGQGYTSVPNVAITDGGGSGATATAEVSGSVSAVTLTSGGSGYAYGSLPTVTATPSSGSTFTTNMLGTFTDVTLAGGGSGYTNSRRPTITIDDEFGAGSGTTIDFDIEGPVNNIVRESEGEGYVFTGANGSTLENATTKPTVTFDGFNVNNDSAAVSFTQLVDASVTSFVMSTAFTGLTASTAYDLVVRDGSGNTIGTFDVTSDASGEIPAGTTVSGNTSTTDVQTVTTLLINEGEFFEDGTNTSAGTFNSTFVGDVTMNGGLQLSLTQGGTYSQEPTITITDSNKTGTETAMFRAYINGSLANISLDAAGSGYRWGDIATDASDPTNTTNYSISLMVSDPQNYDDYSGGSSTASLSFDMEGAVNEVVVTNGGSGYTMVPTIDIAHPGTVSGTQATATATVGYSVSSITITNVGSGYTSKPTVTIDAPTGTGLTRQAFVEADDVDLEGEITAVNVENPGYYALQSGSTSSNQGYISLTSGSVAGFEARAFLNGTVTGLWISQGGRDYNDTPTVTISGGNGSGAAASWTIFGKQYAYTVNAGGSGYHVEPKILEDISAALPDASAPGSTGSQIGSSNLYDHEGVFDVNGGELVMAYNGVEMKTQGYYQSEPTIVIESKQTVAPIADVNISSDGMITGFDVTTTGEGYDKTSAPAVTITTVGPAESSAATISWIPSAFQELGGTISSRTYDSDDLVIEGGEGYRTNVNEITSSIDFQVVGGNPSLSNGVISINSEPGVDKVLNIDYGTGRREVEVE